MPPKHAQVGHINRAPLDGTPQYASQPPHKSAPKMIQVTARCDAASISLGPTGFLQAQHASHPTHFLFTQRTIFHRFGTIYMPRRVA